MDPQSAWLELLATPATAGNYDRIKELYDGLFQWSTLGGFAPVTGLTVASDNPGSMIINYGRRKLNSSLRRKLKEGQSCEKGEIKS